MMKCLFDMFEKCIGSLKKPKTQLLLIILTCLLYGLYHVTVFDVTLLTLNHHPVENRIVKEFCSISTILAIDAVAKNKWSIPDLVGKNLDICIRLKNGNRVNVSEFHRVLKQNISVPISDKMESVIYIINFGKQDGRLGNIMFQYAALWGVSAMAQASGRRRVVPLLTSTPHSRSLYSTFELTQETWLPLNPTVDVVEEKFMAFSKKIVPAIRPGFNYSLKNYFQSWKYFQNISDIIRQKFQFSDYVIKGMKTVLAQIAKDVTVDTTFVGVHIRRGDMTWPYNVKRGFSAAGANYLAKALSYYRAMFANIAFIVCSDDMSWAMANVNGSDVHFSQGNTAVVDLAILSMCDHSVITSGTFGWWSAWLAGGKVVYYRDYPTPGSWLDSECERSDYYPPDWLGLI